MKKITLPTLIILFFSFTAFSQEKINGIGKLKLGSSASVIKEIGYNGKPTKVKTQKKYRSIQNKQYAYDDPYEQYLFFYMIFPDTADIENSISDAVFDDRVEVYYLPFYNPAEGIHLRGLTLKYLNDSLYYIEIAKPGSKLSEALDLKYGRSQIELKEKDKKYINGLGITITKTDSRIQSAWETEDEDISCYEVLYKYHNDKGEENYLKYFLMKNDRIDSEVNESSNRIVRRFKRIEKEKKKATLDDL